MNGLASRAARNGVTRRAGVDESRRRRQYLDRQRAKQLAAKRALVQTTRRSKVASMTARKTRAAKAKRRGGSVNPATSGPLTAAESPRDTTEYFGFSNVPNRRKLICEREARLKNDTWTRIVRYEASQVTNERAADTAVIKAKQARQTAMFDGQLVEKEARRKWEAAEKLRFQRQVQSDTVRYRSEAETKAARLARESAVIGELRERQLKEVRAKRAMTKERHAREEKAMVAEAHRLLMEERERNRIKKEAAIALRNRVLEENMVQLRARKAAKLQAQVDAQRLIDAYREKVDAEEKARDDALAALRAKMARRVEMQMEVMKGVDELAAEDAARALRQQAKKEQENLEEELRRKRVASEKAYEAQRYQLWQIERQKNERAEERQRMRAYANDVIARNVRETAAEKAKVARVKAEGRKVAREQEAQIRELHSRRTLDSMPKRERRIHAAKLRAAQGIGTPRFGPGIVPGL